jgi:tetratricopeptide (TPR) repeat protein
VPHAYIAYVAFREGDAERAREHFRAAMRLDSNFARSIPQSLNTMGNDRAVAGDHAAAIRHYRLALELDPAFADARSNLGVAYARQGMLREAIAEFEKALDLQPGDDVVRRNLAMARDSLETRGRNVERRDAAP